MIRYIARRLFGRYNRGACSQAVIDNLRFIEGELALYDALLHSALRQLSDIRALVLDLRKRLSVVADESRQEVDR